MDNLTVSKLKIRIALIEFKDKCETHGQNGLISCGIAEELIETLSETQIKYIINQLKQHTDGKVE